MIFNVFFFLLVTLTSTQIHASKRKTICGEQDKRELSYDSRVARARATGDAAGCTVTMIGRSCAISAGHCVSTFDIIEFNVPDKNDKGDNTFSKPEDVYSVEEGSLEFQDRLYGKDWAVLRLAPNEVTGNLPGDAQGFYPIAKEEPVSGDSLRISGHGYADDPVMRFSQLSHTGVLEDISDAGVLGHKVDTTGGSSGSSIISTKEEAIVGVHTHGGCSSAPSDEMAGGNEDLAKFFEDTFFFGFFGANSGTSIHRNEDFQNAVQECLAWEEENL